jgi:hypothetical protein
MAGGLKRDGLLTLKAAQGPRGPREMGAGQGDHTYL